MDEWCVDTAWFKTLHNLKHQDFRPSRNGPAKSILGYSMTLLNPRSSFLQNKRRRLSRAYASAELLWYLSGTDDASLIRAYAPSYENYLDDGWRAYGAYGSRWHEEDQLAKIYDVLTDDPDSRQAVMRFWKFGDLTRVAEKSSKDIPCTISIQFLRRDGYLHAVTTMRSNDVWLGFPYDVWCFCQVQSLMASMVGDKPGWYRHQVGNMHLYEKDWEKVCEASLLAPGEDSYETEPDAGVFDYEQFERAVEGALDLENRARKGGHERVLEIIDAMDQNFGQRILGRCVRECALHWRKKASE